MNARADAITPACPCSGVFVEVTIPEWGSSAWICRSCGARLTNSGKFIPPGAWALPGVPVQAIVWDNGNVMTFDGIGRQCDGLQFALGQDDAREAELERIFARERWEWRIWPGNTKGGAAEVWLIGRAAWINRHYRLSVDSRDGRMIAEMENQDGQLLIGGSVTWRAGGMAGYGDGEQKLRPAGADRDRDDPDGQTGDRKP